VRESRRLGHEFLNALRITRRFHHEAQQLTISIAYQTGVEATPRTTAVAEAFGLGLDAEREFVIYDEFTVTLRPGMILYVTGDSGSGKSVLLRWLEQNMPWTAIGLNHVRVDENRPIVEAVGGSVDEALELLSRVGLSEAYLFLRRYRELSDGQKYRFRLAKLLELAKAMGEEALFIVCDEFCSLLDRDTAKIVAYNFQKVCRREGLGLVAATCHADLLNDLKPDLHIHKRFGREVEVKYHSLHDFPPECTVASEVRIEEGTIEDWRRLAPFHYRSHRLPPPRKIFRAKRGDELVGVIVYSYPAPTMGGRRLVLPPMGIHELNQKLSVISRVVVHPKYRNIGVGQRLVRETLNRCGTPYVEAVAVMAKYNPFFERVGMRRVCERPPPREVQELFRRLQAYGWNPALALSPTYNLTRLRGLSERQLAEVREALAHVNHPRLLRVVQTGSPYGRREVYAERVRRGSVELLARIIHTAALLMQTKVYLFWSREWAGNADGRDRAHD